MGRGAQAPSTHPNPSVLSPVPSQAFPDLSPLWMVSAHSRTPPKTLFGLGGSESCFDSVSAAEHFPAAIGTHLGSVSIKPTGPKAAGVPLGC